MRPISAKVDSAGERPRKSVVNRNTPAGIIAELVRTSWLFRIGLGLVGLSLVCAAIGPYVARYPLNEATGAVSQGPSFDHWFGTDASGLDVFSRVVAAPRFDVTIALAATLVSLAVGALAGLFASYSRRRLGELVVRASDTVQAFPLFVLAIIAVVMTGRNVGNIIIVVAALNIPIFLRLVRAEVLAIRKHSFVEAARANGDTELSVAVRHVLPNALSPALAQSSITMGFSILLIAGLSFIGAGVRPPDAEWGSMIAAGADGLVIQLWWPSFFPGLAIALTVFGWGVVGEALRAVYLRET